MEVIKLIFENTSLWEVVMLLIVIYLFARPKLIDRISKFKVGDFEIELRELKKEVAKGQERITELESEIENEKRQFQELLESFDANAPLRELSSVKQKIKAHSRNIADDDFKKYLKKSAKPEELYAAAVGIREQKPVNLLPDIVSLLDELTKDVNLGGFRLNIIWTLTSAIHKIMISIVRHDAKPFPTNEQLNKMELTLRKLESNSKVILDSPDNPMRGIRGPIKYSLDWIQKARETKNNSN